MDDHRSKMRASLACGLALLAGCAAQPALRPPDPSHPASVEAPEGVMREPSALRADAPAFESAAPAPHVHHRHTKEAGHAH